MATIQGTTGRDYLSGGDGNDSLHGGPRGGPIYGSGNDTLDGGDGNDILVSFIGLPYYEDGNDVLYGAHGNHTLDGGVGNDTLCGRDGERVYVFAPGHGDDVIDGLGFRRFSVRGLAKARGEWDLVCLALNIKRLQPLLAV